MNHREQASLDVLQERMTNLISRVDVGFAGQDINLREQSQRITEALNETQRLSAKQGQFETVLTGHLDEDNAVHASVAAHLEAHKKREYIADGRSEALSWIDKAILRYLLPFALAGISIYVALFGK